MKTDEYCRSYTAASLEEYLEIISLLNDSLVKSAPNQQYSPIWYRGHERQDYLLNHLHGRQVFITCCSPETVGLMETGMRFRVENGTVYPEKVS